ncbi:MAG: HAD-IB family hydrolase [Patescibacteria group bacterium]
MKLRHLPKTIFRFLYTLHFFAVFASVAILFYLWGLLTLGHKNRKGWCYLSMKALGVIFYLSNLKISISGLENLPEGPALLTGNHQSFIDGFIVLFATRIPFIAITAPIKLAASAGSFYLVLGAWFRRMGYFAIARDELEEAFYDYSVPRGAVVCKSVDALKRGETILIFPEGKREPKRHLLPFYTGAARIALESKVPVVSVILKNLDHFFPVGSKTLIPCRISIEIQKPVLLHEKFEDPVSATKYLEEMMERHLPRSYDSKVAVVPSSKKRGAFFDLDGTLTRLNISKLMVKQYLWKHPTPTALSRFGKFKLEAPFMRHLVFFREYARLLSGFSPKALQEGLLDYLKQNKKMVFYEEMLELLKKHRERGDEVFVITEEPEALISSIEEFLGVPHFATKLEIKHGVFTGKIMGPINKDKRKREILEELANKHGLDLPQSFAYGNSWQDLDMLKAVGHPTLINPPRSLVAHAKNLGIRIVH